MQHMNQKIIAHQVLFTFKDGYSWQSPIAQQAARVSENHPNEIPQILVWCCGRSLVKRQQAADFSLIGLFNDQQAMHEYMVHPDHQKGVDLWRKISTWTISDILVDQHTLSLFKQNKGITEVT